MVSGRGTLFGGETGLSGQGFKRSQKDGPNPFSERLSDSTVYDEIDRGIENQKEVVKRDQNEKSHRVRK